MREEVRSGRATQLICTGEGPDSRLWGGQGTRGAHVEHEAHDRDLGRVEVERLVELVRFLQSRKAGMRCDKRYRIRPGRRWVAATQSACAGMVRLKAGEARARAERT